jgi:hypothetical protein
VEVAHDALGIGPVGEPAEVGVAGRVERADPGAATLLGDVEDEPQVVERSVDRAVAGEHRPVPGTTVAAASGATTSSSTSIAPLTDP